MAYNLTGPISQECSQLYHALLFHALVYLVYTALAIKGGLMLQIRLRNMSRSSMPGSKSVTVFGKPENMEAVHFSEEAD